MTNYVLRSPAVFKKRKAAMTKPVKNFHGVGYFGGDYPDGVIKIDGVPGVAEVRVIWRGAGWFDGFVVATTQSSPAGTWRVSGLNPNLKYDVVVRKDGFNDQIMSNVSPVVDE